MRKLGFVLAIAVAAQAVPVQAQDKKSEIIVQGTRNRDAEIKAFVRDLTPAPIRGQLGRFEAKVCPRAFGLQGGQNAEIEERIRRVAAAAGVPVANAGCIVNLALFITPDKAGLLKELAHWPGMFPEQWSGATIRDLQNDPDPVAAWQTEQHIWQDGVPLTRDDNNAPEGNMFVPHAVATRLKPSAYPTFVKSVLVIQANALAGLTPVQVADYVAMRSLIKTDPKRIETGGHESILKVVDAPMGSPTPPTLTAWDLSFLKAFYASGASNYVEYQRAQLKGLMKKELDRQQASEH
jgi:hypothetical protein